MTPAVDLSKRIREIHEGLASLEREILDAGREACRYFSPDPHAGLIADWSEMVTAAAALTLLADEILNPPPPP